ncbi:MAG: AAA family ATPase [Bacteroidetes bacterium QH_6_63_17]|nr:MAG: AAA family ATPase [Bacteroidetes bacterium QH_6_63_17]
MQPGPSGRGRLWSFFRSRAALWTGAAIVVALVIHFGLKWNRAAAPVSIEYSTFLEYVESGHVERVAIVNGSRVEGTYTPEAVQACEVSVSATDGGMFDAVTDQPPRAFVTTKPSSHELTAFLRQHNDDAAATVTFTASQEEDWGRTLLLWGLPLGLIVGIWFFFMRQMTAGARQSGLRDNTATLFETAGEPRVTFDDVAGLDEPKAEVAEVVDFLRTPEKFTRLGGALPTGVLLVGPPGTGKTLMARAVAGEAGVPFFSISGSDFMEMFVGVGASRVRDLFESAKEKAPCIIFIDEMDAIGRTRGRGRMGRGSDERDNTLNQLLVEMDGFDSDEGVVIMGATNRPDVLDSALLRPGRFDRQIAIPKPDRLDRAKIFRVHVQDLLLDDTVDLNVLARQTPGFAGAEIANVCNEAALLAARKGKRAIQMADFEQAIDRVIAGLEKHNKLISPEEREVIAHHESGHAVVGWFLEHTDPVVKVSIVPRGISALGYAQHLPEERDLYSKAALLDRLTMALGGRVAEELVFSQVTTGAQDDLERVTKMAYAMVVDYGMSDRLGPLSYNRSGDGTDAPLLGKPYSDATAQAIDEEVQVLVDEARSRARALLEEKRSLLDDMADELLENEVLDRDALVELLGEPPHESYTSTQNQDVVSARGHQRSEGRPPSADGPDGSSSESGAASEEPETTGKTGP